MPIAYRLVARGLGLPAKLHERARLLPSLPVRREDASSAGMLRRSAHRNFKRSGL
ncbi:TPA: hypothetical protein L5P78_006286 [Pseudomonas aeruginosa]|nr:hypothetical protein [Pseudomonas aeruginosa]HBP1742677.1 hypothetical protein [Pseudomonas aeruginosa]